MPARSLSRPDLSRIYGPISADLAEVEHRLSSQMATYKGVVGQIMDHVGRFAGKRMRPGICILTGRALNAVTAVHYDVSVVAEMIHTATLVHDDVLDAADTRRTVPTVNSRWGTEVSVLFGDYLFAKAFSLCAAIDHRDVLQTMAETAKVMCLGELLQNVNRFNFELSDAQYIEILTQKTAYLFGSCAELGVVASGGDAETRKAMRDFGTFIGVAFQIVDDHLDLFGTEPEVGKTLGTDLDGGKMTLPLLSLFGVLGEAKRQELQQFLSRPEAENKRREVVKLLEEHGLAEVALDRAESLVRDAKHRLSVLPASPWRDGLEALADYVVVRQR